MADNFTLLKKDISHASSVDNINDEAISEAVLLLKRGEIIAFPTETFFGLGVDPFNPAAVEKLMFLKDREEGKGVSLILDNMESFRGWVSGEDKLLEKVESLAENFWPGPLTVIMNGTDKLKSILANKLFSKNGSIAVRISSHPIAKKLASLLGGAITATSANPKGKPAQKSSEEVRNYFPEMFVLPDIENHIYEKPSTILDIRTFPFSVIREGVIGTEELAYWIR